MTLEQFLEYVGTGQALDTPEIGDFMNRMSEEARRITFELNASFHTADQVRELLSRLFGRPVDPSLRFFPPFYTDFGRNIAVGKWWLGMSLPGRSWQVSRRERSSPSTNVPRSLCSKER